MTNLADLDRALAEFLEEGPNTAPEAPVIAALAHARTTPRRPDPFAWLRSDAMAVPRRRILGVRPSLALAVVALIAASIGIALVGSRPQAPAVVVSGPSASPAVPSATVEPTIPAPPPFSAIVRLTVVDGGSLELRVVDFGGDVLDATSGTPGDGGSVPTGTVDIRAEGGGRVLDVTWTGSPCQTSAHMSVDRATATIVVVEETCEGDAIPVDRVVRLTFSSPVDSALWHGTVSGGPQASRATSATSPAP